MDDGIIAAGGAGILRFFHGIQTSVLKVNLDRVIIKLEVDS